MPLQIAPVDVSEADRVLRRELRLFNLYRVLEAMLLAATLFGPLAGLIDEPRHQLLARSVAIAFLFIAMLLLAFGRRLDPRAIAFAGIAADLFFGFLAMHAVPALGTGISLMLLFNVGAAALLLPPRLGLGMAAVAVLALLGEHAWSVGLEAGNARLRAEPIMFAVGYAAIATLMSLLGRQMRAGYELAEQRGAEAAHLAEINELIIRRLRTGVLLVDGQGRLRLANEAAAALLGDVEVDSTQGARNLAIAMPELSQRLEQWRTDGKPDETPLQLGPDVPDVVPRFARLLAGSDQTLVFLDDTSIASRRAESMTLATLGRFSASLAHEIRNPLAAISYAVQLLEESDDIRSGDRRLLEIVHQQCQRMNGIVENVLGLARREAAKPEHVDLIEFSRRFVDDYLVCHPLDQDTLQASGSRPDVPAVVDPRQLHQVLTVLVSNALNYGRMPGQPARVTVHVQHDPHGAPQIEVRDRGPGIPDTVASRLFRPFFTTSPHGTGLGLYIARELCRANQASLDYVPMPAGGGCFRIRMQELRGGIVR
ncbi:MAG: Two-component sensor PilS [uncultured Lysobacter sp.]|uniref:histidine kinase n=1 Tax=uncultured Lysobacter sp. TaxID=271060 RepID=A0A6J4KG22_9GAMM|nr:MAG: Two-component sensor PilS [uncultured Lysobacter sp.]